MSVKDVIKNSIYEAFGAGNGLRGRDIILIFVASALFGLYIYFVYKNISKSEFYSKDMNITMAGIPIIVAAIMVAMQASLLVSLGMVGALSIVRFRTAIKNPMDMLFLFWAISCGIISGVNLHIISLILCVALTLIVVLLNKIPIKRDKHLLIVRTDKNADTEVIRKIVAEQTKSYKERSVVLQGNEIEMYLEVVLKKDNSLISVLGNQKEIISVNIMSANGELRV